MNYANLIQNITENIKTNGSQAITAQVLQDVLVDMVGELGQSGALLGGVIDTSFVPDPTNDAQVVYIAESPGTYTNFNGLVVGAGEVAFFYFDGNAWAKSSVDVLEVVNSLNSTATDKALSAAMGKQLSEEVADSMDFSIRTASHKSINAVSVSANTWYLFPYFDGSSKFVVTNEGSGKIRFWLRYNNSSSVQEYFDVDGNSKTTITPGSQYNGLLFFYQQYSNAGTFRVYPLSPEQEATESAISQNASDIASAESDIEKIQEKTADLYVDVPYDVTASPDYTVSGSYIMSNGAFGAGVPFSLVCYDVQQGDRYKISTTGGAGFARRWALYNTEDIGQIGTATLADISADTIAANTDVTVTCSVSGILAVQNYTAFSTFVVSKVESEQNYITRSGLASLGIPRYSISGDTIQVSQNYDESHDLVVEMKKRGGNNLFEFARFYLINKGDNLANVQTVLFANGSDWFGPYQVAANQDIDGDDIDPDTGLYRVTFTGGNHQYNNQGSGSTPTARCAFVKFYADGVEKVAGMGYAREIKMVWANYIQGYNTKLADGSGREILREDTELTFDGRTFRMRHSFTPLEDVTVKVYYGLQFGGYVPSGWLNKSCFTNSDTAREFYTTTVPNPKAADSVIAFGDDIQLEMSIDPTFDLGKRTHIPANEAYFFLSGSKFYGRIVYQDTVFTQDNVYRLEGGWTFSKPI